MNEGKSGKIATVVVIRADDGVPCVSFKAEDDAEHWEIMVGLCGAMGRILALFKQDDVEGICSTIVETVKDEEKLARQEMARGGGKIH